MAEPSDGWMDGWMAGDAGNVGGGGDVEVGVNDQGREKVEGEEEEGVNALHEQHTAAEERKKERKKRGEK